ncbi:NAD(P)-binding protein [Wenzhouxiangella sp. XN79A]|uniref:NAD(P)/FAD-dependent oxidoreductase n=1 Tax=Wenzhouxiangella sp. XN79A TaxID=2724193 RepID=UPI00144A7268|nr:FAD-dependent oxidoreductase [Wenzhouxiangella sp. XN79A]NKI34464.1 NAD(P)-binding protein [Wenzhouxiangella sp. XN79A]
MFDTLVIGAGWAGLTAAARLTEAGQRVQVVEKSRGPGGRSATRRDDKNRFDHGAQYFTARSAAFGRQIQQWRDDGWIEKWTPRLAVLGGDGGHRDTENVQRFVAVPGMNGVCRRLAEGLECRFRSRVERLEFEAHWTAMLEDGEVIEARRVLVTAPPAQAAALLGPTHPLHGELAGTVFHPCITLMAAFERALEPRFDAAFVNDDPTLDWIARNSSKPGRSGECWVAHATAEWSRAHLEEDVESLAAALAPALCARLEVPEASLKSVAAHRWRYAQAAAPRQDGVLVHAEQRLVVAGDWLAGSRVEGAWSSGRKAADWLAGTG